jgi:hypothetical protein
VALVSRNKLLYACVREVCRLCAQPRFDTFHQLLIIVEALWSQPVPQLGKQVVVARSEIRAVRRVVKQLPVEMLQHCSSVSSCMRMRIFMEEHYTVCQHSMPVVLNEPTQFSFSVSQNTFWRYCVNSTTSIPFLSQKTVVISFLAGRQRLFKLFRLVWWMCVHPLHWLLFVFNIHKRDSGFITCYLYDLIKKFITIFVVSL